MGINTEMLIERLLEIRDKLSVRKFAVKCDISESVMRSYMSGSSIPGLDKAIKIADANNICLEWLANGVGSKHVSNSEEFITISNLRIENNQIIEDKFKFKKSWLKGQNLEPNMLYNYSKK